MALSTPCYKHALALQITRLTADILHTWINRGVVILADQHPGSGRKRLYAAIDIIKLAVMRRFWEMRIDLSVAREVAALVEHLMHKNGAMGWDVTLLYRRGSPPPLSGSDDDPAFGHCFELVSTDMLSLRVGGLTEAFEPFLPRRGTEAAMASTAMDPVRRDMLARYGVHAEPVMVMPLGEIVNATLLQLEAIDRLSGIEQREGAQVADTASGSIETSRP